MQAAESRAKAHGQTFITVKTLADTHPDEGYARTRAFHMKLGFIPLEVLPLWGEDNPCLLMAKML